MTRQPMADVGANLSEALAALVPLAIAELRGTTFEQRRARVAGAADLIASSADQMMFGKGKKATGVLAAIVNGVAVGAYQPGGISVLGVHACAHPHPWCPASARRSPCCTCDPATCTTTTTNGTCPDASQCRWCANGCPNAYTGAPCCAPTHVTGQLVLVERS